MYGQKVEHVKRKQVEKASKSTTKSFGYERERGKWKRWQQQVLSERRDNGEDER